jgi:hypothetical protein
MKSPLPVVILPLLLIILFSFHILLEILGIKLR